MNIGEKISLYKERLGFKNYSDFGKAVGISGSWINELSKKEEIKQVNDIGNLVKLCEYLGITIEQLVTNDDDKIENQEIVGEINIDENCDNDIGIMIDNMIKLLDTKDSLKMNGALLNDKAKKICRDSLEITKTLTKQHL